MYRIVIALATALLFGCSDSSDRSEPAGPSFLPIPTPEVSLPPDAGRTFLQLTNYPLERVGYRLEEFFISGRAASFTNLSELDEDGDWRVEALESATYRTRIAVVRPLDDADFSGTVIVEWLNVSGGFEIAPSWNAARVEILRSGHVWVGVSAQRVGIEGSDAAVVPLHLKAVNPERYGSLEHPGDSFSYDMFSQAGQALRDPATGVLAGLDPELILAFGESQSAGRMVTYINALQPLYNGFDGYMVHSRGGSAPPLAQLPQLEVDTPEVVRIRTDLTVPVFTFQTETDLFGLRYIRNRQPDSDVFRLWETAGTAHGDLYTVLTGFNDDGTDPSLAVVSEQFSVAQGILTCALPLNAGPQPWLFNAATRALVTWAGGGAAPPEGERLAVTDDESAFVFDALGNVQGGVRSPYVDAPAAVLSGEGQSDGSFCRLFGTTTLFPAEQMASLYIDREGYINAVSDAAERAVARGFLLPPDAERIVAAAGLQWDSLTP